MPKGFNYCITEAASKSTIGFKYFATFTDDNTRYSVAYSLLNKEASTILTAFSDYQKRAEKIHHPLKIKALRTDGGTEYLGEMSIHLNKRAIEHQMTTHYSPESNGVAERLNRTLNEMAMSMLFAANLPDTLWPQAIGTAVYIRNRLPHSALKGDTTPFELWTGHKPSLAHLCTFGCKVYVHVPKAKGKKYGPKSQVCYLVGYGESDGIYKVYDPKSNKVHRVRNVVFDENTFLSTSELNKFRDNSDDDDTNSDHGSISDSYDFEYESDSAVSDFSFESTNESPARHILIPRINGNNDDSNSHESNEGSVIENTP